MSGTIDYVPLKIMLNTNNGDAVELKSNMFIFETDTTKTISGDGPYICTNVNYAKTVLQPLTHRERVEKFMNKDKFLDFCITSKSKKGITPEDNKTETNEIIQNNVFIMLNAMFPTQFPIKDSVESMSSDYKLDESIFVQFTKPSYQAYLNIKKPSTVTRAVWINLMTYHPEYIKLFGLVKKYFKKMYQYYIKVFETGENANFGLTKDNETNKSLFTGNKLNDDSYINIVNAIADTLKSKTLEQLQKMTDEYVEPKKKTALWKLYFMLKGLIPNTQDYNAFIEKYVELFINVRDKKTIELENEIKKLENEIKTLEQKQNEPNQTDEQKAQNNTTIQKNKIEIQKHKREIETIEQRKNRGFTTEKQRQENNESQFNSSVKTELEFHFNYIKEIIDYMPQNRQSLNEKVSGLFKDNVLNAQEFVDIMEKKRDDFEKYAATVDKIKNGDSYEIQVGLSIVGGIVTEATRSMSCLFNSVKLAKMVKDKTNNIVGVPMYPYVDFEEQIKKAKEQAKTQQPPIPPKKRGGARRSNKKRQNKRQRYTRKDLQRCKN